MPIKGLSQEDLRFLKRNLSYRRQRGKPAPPAEKPKLGPQNPGWFAPTTGPAWLGSYTYAEHFYIDKMGKEKPRRKAAKPAEKWETWRQRWLHAQGWAG